MTTSFGVAGTPTRVPNPPARASRSMQARGADVTASLGRYAASAARRRGALRRDSPVNRARRGGHRGERFQPARAGLGEALGEHAARVNLENIPNLASSTVTQTQTSSVDDSVARLSSTSPRIPRTSARSPSRAARSTTSSPGAGKRSDGSKRNFCRTAST